MNDDRSAKEAAAVPGDVGAYTREAEAACELEELRKARPADVLASLDERSPEALVAIMRDWVRRGDAGHAWELCERMAVGIERWVMKRLHAYHWIGPDEREDILRDLALRLYEEWMTCDGRHRFWEIRFWHCLRCRLIDTLRSRRPEQVGTDLSGDGVLELAAGAISPEEWAVGMLSLSRLPERTRRVFVMKYYEGYTEDQIADRMGVTSRTIRNWIRQGHEAMRAESIPGAADGDHRHGDGSGQ